MKINWIFCLSEIEENLMGSKNEKKSSLDSIQKDSSHARIVPFDLKRFWWSVHIFIRWQRLSISYFFGLSEIQLLFYCNSNPRPSYICGQFSLL